ncbi:MAG: plasmid pRiA4b ORF-3 family protein [PVC group bacterium]
MNKKAKSMKSSRITRFTSEKSMKIYQLKISLDRIRPLVWRRLLVRGDANLGFLHAVIQVALGWTNSHLHQFIITRRIRINNGMARGQV